MNQKIKLFLGAYVNFPNAQNINCDNIARYLDKDKFEVHTMYTDKMPINKEYYKSQDIHLHRLIHHRYIWYWCKLLTMLFSHSDIYYLPKAEPPDKLLAKILKKKATFVSSIEGVVTKTTNNTPENRKYHLETMNNCFAISECISKSVENNWKIKLRVLPLGVRPLNTMPRTRDKIRNIIWVGNIKANKRPLWLVECAKSFPELSFTMVGDGDLQEQVDKQIQENGLRNIHRTGRIPNVEVYQHMIASDLLLMTSEYEGLPKVIQEAAQCGIPSIYVCENYSVDFITDGVNGYGVRNLDEMKEKVILLLENPTQYKKMSVAASEMIRPYLWPTLIKQYEDFFESLVKE